MIKNSVISVRMLIVLTLLTGLIYPLSMTAVVQILFPRKANGSLIKNGERIIGSELIGQNFQSDRYFWPRPSATDYNPLPSGASNLGPTSAALRKLVAGRRLAFLEKNYLSSGTVVPNEMLFASASGIDPHISPAAAMLQADRIARARSLDNQGRTALENLVRQKIEMPQFGFFGEPRVNVLTLNIELDRIFP